MFSLDQKVKAQGRVGRVVGMIQETDGTIRYEVKFPEYPTSVYIDAKDLEADLNFGQPTVRQLIEKNKNSPLQTMMEEASDQFHARIERRITEQPAFTQHPEHLRRAFARQLYGYEYETVQEDDTIKLRCTAKPNKVLYVDQAHRRAFNALDRNRPEVQLFDRFYALSMSYEEQLLYPEWDVFT